MVDEVHAGVVAGYNTSLPITIAIVAFITLSWYNMLELVVIIFTSFKSRSGLYFWSFVTATAGLAPYGIGFILKFFKLTSVRWIPVSLVGFGLIGMVTGQSFVLYSRLHLIVRDSRILRWVLCMITFDAIAFHLPAMILALGVDSPQSEHFLPAFLIYDKIQLTVFFTQECIISGIYIYATVRLLAPAGEPMSKPLRDLLTHLIVVNIFVLALDCTVLAFGYSGYYQMQTTFKAAVYSVKLKVEFSVLNSLVGIVQKKDLVLGVLMSGSTSEGSAWRSETMGDDNFSRTFGSVGSGSGVAAHGGFMRMDRMNNPYEEDTAPTGTDVKRREQHEREIV